MLPPNGRPVKTIQGDEVYTSSPRVFFSFLPYYYSKKCDNGTIVVKLTFQPLLVFRKQPRRSGSHLVEVTVRLRDRFQRCFRRRRRRCCWFSRTWAPFLTASGAAPVLRSGHGPARCLGTVSATKHYRINNNKPNECFAVFENQIGKDRKMLNGEKTGYDGHRCVYVLEGRR